MNKILSVVIPTYNRSKDLDVQIEWAVKSIGESWDKVELIICDNASDDKTTEVCQKWKLELGEKILIFRNQENVGLVRNCFLSIERATGQYVWLVGDDDPIRVNGVEKILDIIASHSSIGLIHINHRCVSSIDGSIIIPRFYELDVDINATTKSAQHLNELLQTSNTGGLMFITANVINRELALEFIKKNPPKEDLLLVYPLFLNIGLASLNGFYLISDCLVDCAYYASSWLDKMEFVQYEAIPRTLIKLKGFGISSLALKSCMNFQFKPLQSIKEVSSLIKQNPIFLLDKKFNTWARRRLLKSMLNLRLIT